MRKQGYTASGPLSEDGLFKEFDLDDPKISKREKRAAKADVACKFEVNLLGVMNAVESDHQNKLIEKNAEALAEVKEQLVEKVKKLNELVRKYGG